MRTVSKLVVLVGVVSILALLVVAYLSIGSVNTHIHDENPRTLRKESSSQQIAYEILSSTDNVSDEDGTDKSQTEVLASLSSQLTKLQARMEQRDLSLSRYLDDIKNTALADLEMKDKLSNLVSNFSDFERKVEKDNQFLSDKIDDLITKSENDKTDSVHHGPVTAPPPKKNLLILVGHVGIILAQSKIGDFDHVSMVLREQFFGAYLGRDTNVTNKQLLDRMLAPSCEFTTDASRFNESDVVIFYSGTADYRDLEKRNVRVLRAFPEQRFVFHFFEQPFYYEETDLTIMNQRVGFNWTVHYQQDSTVFWPYGTYKRRPAPVAIRPNYADPAAKTRKAFWIVSRCFTLYNHREHYVAELMKYIDVDVYGKCADEHATGRVSMDIGKVARHHKFFISFENGDCDDYITEKFFRYLKDIDMIPIVLGRRNHYEQLAPDYSYIQADQFDTPQQLAAYLHILDKDDALYNRYFEWKRIYYMEYMPRPWCTLCETFRNKWYTPSQIDMHAFQGRQRCWKANRNLVPDYAMKMQSVANYTFSDPWKTIRELNRAPNKPLRFA